jgi:tetratricopeptide (TPR) repeat protein
MLQAAPADIVITGKRLVEAQQQCATGGCTPLRDAQATIALAETQFRAGNYLLSKRLLADAVSRNKNNESVAPKPVAALYEAYATVALHEGDQETCRSAVAGWVRTLKTYLPPDDGAVIAATTALGDMWLKLRQFRRAEISYRSAERDALQAGQPRAAMLAGMRLAVFNASVGKKAAALRQLDDLAERPIATEPGFATALRVLRFRIAARDADEGEITRLVRDLNEKTRAEPLLLWGPPYELDQVASPNDVSRRMGDRDAIVRSSGEHDALQWADVGFWIRPDGPHR